jgi:hypothetical protein
VQEDYFSAFSSEININDENISKKNVSHPEVNDAVSVAYYVS